MHKPLIQNYQFCEYRLDETSQTDVFKTSLLLETVTC